MTDAVRTTRRDAEGNPYWTFIVQPSHLLHNCRAAFPAEVAGILGCSPDALTRVSVAHPAGCRKLLVSWERQEPSRTIIRRLAEPLVRLAAARDQAVDLVVTGPSRVEFRLTANVATAPLNTSPVPQATPLAPWGRPPTPLLPRWYSEQHGEKRLPAGFTRVYSESQDIQDLRGFWKHYSEPLRKDVSWILRDMAQRLMPPKQLRVLTPYFDVEALDRLPLLNRTRNCVRRGLDSGALANGTVGELLRLPNFGIASLLELMCVLEAAEGFPEIFANATVPDAASFTAEAATPDDAPDRGAAIPDAGATPDATELLAAILPRWSLAIRSTAVTCDAAELVVAAAREFRGAASLGDLLRLDLSDLIAAAAADSALAEVPLEDDSPRLADRAVGAVDACLGRMSETERLVVLERVAASAPKSLKEIGSLAGLSRERIRQFDKRVRAALEATAGPALGLLSLVVSERLGPVTTRPEIESAVVEFLPSSGNDCVGAPSLTATRRMLLNRLGYECREGLCLSSSAADAAKQLKDMAHKHADDEGLLDLSALRAALAEQWHEYLDDLIRWIGWSSVSGRFVLRATARARAKAALLRIGASATRAEIAAESGLAERQVAGALSSIKSVARADKSRWGLREWIDDVYEGIPAEIVQRINEDGGSTRLNRVLEELPRLFGVSESSVWAYLNTPAFRIEHGWVSEVHQHEFHLAPLDEVIDGYNEDGEPCWTFEIAQRHLEGYSLHGVPPEIAAALGCSFGSRSTASVRHPQGCQDISIIWRKTSIHGPEIGRLSEAIRALNARDATSIGLIIHNHAEVTFVSASLLQHALARTPANVRTSSDMTAFQNLMGGGVRMGTALSGRFLGPPTSAEGGLLALESAHG